MPVTKTAKRALRSSKKKESTNKIISTKLSIAIRLAQSKPSKENVKKAISSVDIASKKHVIHKNKAGRIKSRLSKLVPTKTKEGSSKKKAKTPKNSKNK